MDQDTLRFLLREAVRETVTEVLQTVLELDRTAFLQAHGGRRNGYYPRKLETTFGRVDLKVPRDREGQYYPAFLKPYARRLVDVGEVAVALYAAGVSQRKAAEVMSLLLGHRYSHETISALTEEVLQAVEAFRRRPLPEEMAFVYLDGLYLKLLREGEGVVREVVYVALGVTPSGERRVLGYWLLPAESALGWEGVLGELWQRGLRRVLLFITDGLPGLPEAIQRVYPQAEWQRCVVHGVRWSLGQVRARDRTLLAEDLRRVYGAESRGEALEALEALREAWGARYPGVVALWAGDSGAFLRFYGYPKVLWPYLRSTNLMERFIREIRRGTKVRDHKFPSEEAVYKLLYLESPERSGPAQAQLPERERWRGRFRSGSPGPGHPWPCRAPGRVQRTRPRVGSGPGRGCRERSLGPRPWPGRRLLMGLGLKLLERAEQAVVSSSLGLPSHRRPILSGIFSTA
jgi:putative transposase